MAKQVTCPVCDMQWEGVERCPCDGWELGEKVILTPDPDYERKYRERLERAREAVGRFKAGAMGLGEEGLQKLREVLRALGLEPGPELEKWAGRNLPGPFGGDCCLAITTSEEAEVFIDGQAVGTTRNRYLLVEDLKAGKHRVEAKARYGYGVVEVELAPGDVQQCPIKLQTGKGFLRVLSEVGVLTLEVDGKSYQVPAQIEVEAGRKELRVKKWGSFYFPGRGRKLYEVEVLPGQTAEVRVTRLQQARIKVAERVNLCLLTFSLAGVLSFLPAIIMLAANFFFSAVLPFIASVVTFATIALFTYLKRLRNDLPLLADTFKRRLQELGSHLPEVLEAVRRENMEELRRRLEPLERRQVRKREPARAWLQAARAIGDFLPLNEFTFSIPVAAIYGSLTAVAPQWAGFLGLGVCLLGAIGAALDRDLDMKKRLTLISILLVAAGAHGLSAFFWNSRTV